MRNGIAEKIINPSNCLLAITLPLTKEDFYSDLKNDKKDYARSRKALYEGVRKKNLWTNDHLPFVELYNKTKKELVSCGVNIMGNFKIADLKEIDKYDVTTFITHSIKEKNQVEFYDGLFSDLEFVKNMPENYLGIIDLTICNSTFLIEPIKNKHSKCIIIAHEKPATLDFSLIFYKNLMRLLSIKDLNYTDAYTELRLSLITK